MRCRKIQALLSEYLEGELRGRLAELVYQHLATCAGCKQELAELRSALGALARSSAAACPSPNLGDLYRRIAAAEARCVAPRRRWVYALAPVASLLVAVTLWLTVYGNHPELSPNTIAYNQTVPSVVPVLIEPPPSVRHPQPATTEPVAASVSRRTPAARRGRIPVSVARRPKRNDTGTVPPDKTPVVHTGSYEVSLVRPDVGTISISSSAHTLASGEPTKVYINYEGPAGGAGTGTSDEGGTTL